MISSIADFQPSDFGLPPFKDWNTSSNFLFHVKCSYFWQNTLLDKNLRFDHHEGTGDLFVDKSFSILGSGTLLRKTVARYNSRGPGWRPFDPVLLRRRLVWTKNKTSWKNSLKHALTPHTWPGRAILSSYLCSFHLCNTQPPFLHRSLKAFKFQRFGKKWHFES